MSYYELAREARSNISAATTTTTTVATDTTATTNPTIKAKKDNDATAVASLWRSRLHDLGIRVANALIEMDDPEAAALHLASLGSVPNDKKKAGADDTDTAVAANANLNDGMRLREALVWLSLGNVQAAEKCLERMSSAKPHNNNDNSTGSPTNSSTDSSTDSSTARDMLAALLQIADGNFSAAVESWKALSRNVNNDNTKDGHDVFPAQSLVMQNQAVCSLYAGRMDDARHMLERIADQSRPFHTLTFNLASVYELCGGERAHALKMGLARKVTGAGVAGVDDAGATRDSGEGGGGGTEMIAADFKL